MEDFASTDNDFCGIRTTNLLEDPALSFTKQRLFLVTEFQTSCELAELVQSGTIVNDFTCYRAEANHFVLVEYQKQTIQKNKNIIF